MAKGWKWGWVGRWGRSRRRRRCGGGATDPSYEGGGIHVDGVRAWNADGDLIFNGERPADAARFQSQRSQSWISGSD